MKYLALTLALIIGSPSIVNADELNGRALICKKDGEEDKYNYRVYAFDDGKVRFFSAPKKRDWKERGLFFSKNSPTYKITPSKITWPMQSDPTSFKSAHYVVNRRTYQLSLIGAKNKILHTLSCDNTLIIKVSSFFDQNIRNMEAEKNKNTPSKTADAKIQRLEAEAKRLKIQKLEREIARLKGETNTPSQPVQQRQAPVRRTPVNTKRHFADEYSCRSNDFSCFKSFEDQYGSRSKRAIEGGSNMTEGQYFLTKKILVSRISGRKLSNKSEMLELLDFGVRSGQAYDKGAISKDQYSKLFDKGIAWGERLEKKENSANWKKGFFAFTRALQGQLQRQERNYQEQMRARDKSKPSHLGMYQREYMQGMNTVCVYSGGTMTLDGLGDCPW